MREMSDKELKNCLLDMMSYLHEVCVKNEIPYMLQSGSCLGAVRHNGFIPWDNDMDVAVERKYYDKLIKILDGTNDRYVLMTDKNTKNYIYPFAKLIDNKTKIVEDHPVKVKNYGVFIDIFPIDGLPNDYKLMKKHIEMARKKIFCIYRKNIFIYDKNPLKSFLKKIRRYFYIRGNAGYIKSLNKICKKYDLENSKFVMDLCWGNTFYPKACLKNVILHDFEGRKFFIPRDYDIYLTCVYGDYMKLPPKEEQISHEFQAYFKD